MNNSFLTSLPDVLVEYKRENQITGSPGLVGKKSKSPIQISANPDRYFDGGESFCFTDFQ